MSNEKPKPIYELVEANENPNLSVIRKTQAVDFKIDDLLNFISESMSEIDKAKAMVKYQDAVMENVKGFHPEIFEYFISLVDEKKTAFIVFAKAFADKEKKEAEVKFHTSEIEKYQKEIAEIEEATGVKAHK